MCRVISIGNQDFASIREKNCFYIDKTAFMKEWWENEDTVTLITRPRRFGKTLNLSMMDYFWNNQHKEKKKIFEGLDIWKEKKYRGLQGSYPVIFLSFAGVKETTCDATIQRFCQMFGRIFTQHNYLLKTDLLEDYEKRQFLEYASSMKPKDAPVAINILCEYLSRYYGQKVLIFLDEYDTPMQEAYVNGFFDEMVSFIRNLFNNTFKTNPYLERAILTGVTRISKESIFSDLNNLKVVTMVSDCYASYFGFTEEEVFAALDEYGISEKEKVKQWYDGFTIGEQTDIYNPWSIIEFLDTKKYDTFWANTSSNGLVGKLLQEGNDENKKRLESLIRGDTILVNIDDEIVFNRLDEDDSAVWSLLFASGYLKIANPKKGDIIDTEECELTITNYETVRMFKKLIKGWFKKDGANYNHFVQALLRGNVKEMNAYMNRMTESMFSYFDVGNKPSGKVEPERFYHGFVLGLLVELEDQYIITSNRESGFGRYDVLLEPKDKFRDGIILEFKVIDPEEEASLKETVQAALKQIAEKKYAQTLVDHGIPMDHIRSYGFSFEGKRVLIGD